MLSDENSMLRWTEKPDKLSTLDAPTVTVRTATTEATASVDVDPAQFDIGRDKALAALFSTSYTPLVRLATLLGADDPEDVVAEAFYQLYRRWPKLRNAGLVDSYVKSVVCNLTRMRIRHLQVARRHVQTILWQESVTSGASSAETSALHHEDQRVLVQTLQQLPSRQRESLVLRYWMDLPEREMAQIMGISGGSVKTHLRRGLAALTKAMETQS